MMTERKMGVGKPLCHIWHIWRRRVNFWILDWINLNENRLPFYWRVVIVSANGRPCSRNSFSYFQCSFITLMREVLVFLTVCAAETFREKLTVQPLEEEKVFTEVEFFFQRDDALPKHYRHGEAILRLFIFTAWFLWKWLIQKQNLSTSYSRGDFKTENWRAASFPRKRRLFGLPGGKF